MPLVKENSLLYEVIKVGTVSGVPLQVSGVTSISSGTVTGTFVISNTSSNPVPITDSGSSLTVDGKAYRSMVQFTRPNDASGYVAGDVIGASGSAIHTLSGVGPSGGYILIQSVEFIIDSTSVPSGMGSFRTHFYTSTPSGITDNAAFNLVSGEAGSYVGYIDLPTPLDLGSTLYTQTDYPGRLIQLASGSTSLFCEIQTVNAYTPASGTSHMFRVKTLEAGL
jgi:hypothetical protein